jgi:hypothetical protein
MTSETDDLEQVRRDLAAFKRAGRAERRAEIRAEIKDRWLRCVGYVTRTLVYLNLLFVLYQWLRPSEDLSSRTFGSLTFKEIAEPLLFLCALYFWWRFFFNHDGDVINWEAWGKIGLGLVAVAAAGGFWIAILSK